MKPFNLVITFVLATLFFAPTLTHADEPSVHCTSYASPLLGHDVRYCVDRSHPEQPIQNDEPVVYFMHGINGGANSWMDNGYAEALRVLRQEESFPAMTFISFDTSATSFFADRGDVHSGGQAYETWLITEFLGQMERTLHVCGHRECRALAGLSMGGFGALQTALRHSDLFFMVAVNSPAIPPFNIWADNVAWFQYFSRHPVGVFKGGLLRMEAQRIFPSGSNYDEHDPTWLASSFRDLTRFPILSLDVGGRDYFGFQEGYQTFTNVLNERHVAYTSYFEPTADHDLFWQRRWQLIRFLRDHFSISSKKIDANFSDKGSPTHYSMRFAGSAKRH